MARAHDVVIDAHIDDVFAFLADFTNAPRWAPGVVSVDQVAGDGPGPGALYEVTRSHWGRRRRTTVVCTGWDPPRQIALREDQRDVVYGLEPVWTATRVIADGAAVRDLLALRRAFEGP